MEELQNSASAENFHRFCGMADWKSIEQIEEETA